MLSLLMSEGWSKLALTLSWKCCECLCTHEWNTRRRFQQTSLGILATLFHSPPPPVPIFSPFPPSPPLFSTCLTTSHPLPLPPIQLSDIRCRRNCLCVSRSHSDASGLQACSTLTQNTMDSKDMLVIFTFLFNYTPCDVTSPEIVTTQSFEKSKQVEEADLCCFNL